MPTDSARPRNIRFIPNPTFPIQPFFRLRAIESMKSLVEKGEGVIKTCSGRSWAGRPTGTAHSGALEYEPASQGHARDGFTKSGIDHLPGLCFTFRRWKGLEGITTSSKSSYDEARRYPQPGARPDGVARRWNGHPVGAAAQPGPQGLPADDPGSPR